VVVLCTTRRRRRTSLEDIAGRIKMRFLRDKQSNETNARCHVELFVSLPAPSTLPPSPSPRIQARFSYLSVLPPPDLTPVARFVSCRLNVLRSPFLRFPEIRVLSPRVGRERRVPSKPYIIALSGQMTIAIPSPISHCTANGSISFSFSFIFNAG
jgi:hypothetical protein